MKGNMKSYPYPVVGNENDVEGRFVVTNFVRNLSPDTISLEYGFEITNSTLKGLVESGQAKIVIQVECSTTFYRQAFTTQSMVGSIDIPANKLRERVMVRFYVCADKAITDYLPEGSHPDYEGSKFEVEKGDVLAEGSYTSFIAEKTFDPLNSPVDSLIRVKPGKNKDAAQVDFEQDKILIELPEDDYAQYIESKGRKLTDSIHATLAFPVLVEAINAMSRKNTDLSEYTWFERVNQICIDRGLDINEPYVAAQKILSNPIGRNFRKLNETITRIEDQD